VIVDSSALVAIAFGEPEQRRLIKALARAAVVRIAAPTWLETSIVLSSTLGSRLDTFMSGVQRQFAMEVVGFDSAHARIAQEAWLRYGRGNHPAKLNFGDCISYAAAQVAGEPLLFVGADFSQTDVAVAE
jgi:ribonuclease VapC